MSKFNYKKVMPRYTLVAVLMTLIATAVILKALYTMTARHDYWMKVAEQKKIDSLPIPSQRGNILSCDMQLMSSSLPKYMLYMDFKAGGEKKDSMWRDSVDLICEGLSKIFPQKSAKEFKQHLEEGHSRMSQNWAIWPKRVDYNTYMAVKKLPVFKLSPYKGGFHKEDFNARQRPFGNLARRTIGDLYAGKDVARYGLELSYDSILRGKNGIKHRRKVMDQFLDITDTPPVDGADIVTTIDVGMQDLAERCLVDMLKEISANVGVAIVMEVKTGDVKAIVNMERDSEGNYTERQNHAVSDLLEPGSVFKTASMMVALDDGVVDTTAIINTGGGIMQMHSRYMKDHNWSSGGYGTINFARALEVSSNIGISYIIDKHYSNNPEKFVEGIYRTGLTDNLGIPIMGASSARVRMPKKNDRGQYVNWSKTALPWMSIGYETQVPPISTLTFYNAIANNGRMMQPRFVKQIVKDGEVIEEIPPKVMRERICKESTVKIIQQVLRNVVLIGTGKIVNTQSFGIAGKTGTAQIWQRIGNNSSGKTGYLVSFAGYFPYEDPRYSCIVCIQKSGLPASGGKHSGVVVRRIAEGIMAQSIKRKIISSDEPLDVIMPEVKFGNMLAADYVLSKLGYSTSGGWNGKYATGKPIWGTVQPASGKTMALKKEPVYASQLMPNVIGMGARDAVYAIESRGVKVKLAGRGKVSSQSLPAGHKIKKGDVCTLQMN